MIAVTLHDTTAIVGVGPTACGALSRTLDSARRPSTWAAEACSAAVEDAGRAKAEVDGMRIWPQGKRSP